MPMCRWRQVLPWSIAVSFVLDVREVRLVDYKTPLMGTPAENPMREALTVRLYD